jgi:AmmeMemoRadiSam system protein B
MICYISIPLLSFLWKTFTLEGFCMKRLEKRLYRFCLIALYFLVVTANCKSQNIQVDRQPAVAGQFYPSDTAQLNSTLKNLFSKAVAPKNIKNVVAIISPHADYVYSGEVAASSFSQIDPAKDHENIFIIGSSHQIAFDGASIFTKGNFITPIGTVNVNRKLAEELIKKNKFLTDRADVHLYEHSLKVQLPFLQFRMKKDFQVVPIIIGTQNSDMCKKIANALRPFLNNKNLFIISTDFSHYPNYTDAVKVDKTTADAIVSNSPKILLETLEQNEMKGIPNLATSLCG